MPEKYPGGLQESAFPRYTEGRGPLLAVLLFNRQRDAWLLGQV